MGLQSGPTQLVSRLWRAQVAEGERLYYVTQHRRRGIAMSGSRMSRPVSYTVYKLHRHDTTHSGQHLFVELSNDAPVEVLGVAGGLFWLWQNDAGRFGVEGRDLITLEQRVGPTSIAAANPEMGGLLPDDAQFVEVSERLDTLLVKSLDARQFVMELPRQLLLPSVPKPAQKEQDRLEGRFPRSSTVELYAVRRSSAASLPGSGVDGFLHNDVRVGDTWYALLSGGERDSLSEGSPQGSALRPSGDVFRSLYRVPLRTDRSEQDVRLDLSRLQAVGTGRYLKGGLLIRWDAKAADYSVWLPDRPESVLVMSRSTLSEEAPWRMARLGLDGTQGWEVDTEVVEITQVLTGGQTVVITGYPDLRAPLQSRILAVVFVRLADGRISRSDLDGN